MTPNFWFLLVDYKNDSEMTKDSLISIYTEYLGDYYDDFIYFSNINYPEILIDKKTEYNKLALRDYNFQRLFLDYLKNDNFFSLKDSIINILKDEDINLVETIIDTL